MTSHRLRTTIRGLAVLGALALIGCSSITHSNVANSNKPLNSNVDMADQNNKSSGSASNCLPKLRNKTPAGTYSSRRQASALRLL
jgi:hypothetical protein